MAAIVHGWRVYRIQRSEKTGEPCLCGGTNIEVHTNPVEAAYCKGFTPHALWQDAKIQDHSHEHGEDEVPYKWCTCGYYCWRLYPSEQTIQTYDVVAHVTAIGRCQLHADGFRCYRYIIDYLHPMAIDKMIIWEGWPNPEGQDQNPQWIWSPTETLLARIAKQLGVRILKPTDGRGCHHCQKANGWLPEEEEDENREAPD